MPPSQLHFHSADYQVDRESNVSIEIVLLKTFRLIKRIAGDLSDSNDSLLVHFTPTNSSVLIGTSKNGYFYEKIKQIYPRNL